MLNKIFDFFTRRKIIRRKKESLIEVEMDIAFIEQVKTEELELDEADARAELSSELNKDEKEKDYSKIKRLSQLIADSKETKAEYEKLKIMRRELPRYIKIND